MLLSMLHGLRIRRNPVPTVFDYSTLISDVHLAPYGKTYGSYIIDSSSSIAISNTTNLPDVSGYIKNVQVNFLLERSATSNGDFIIATAEPFFPSNLGTPIISEHYIKALKGRKFISYQQSGLWTDWKELNSGIDYAAMFSYTNASDDKTLNIDPNTIRHYSVTLGLNSELNINYIDADTFTKPVFINIEPESTSYTLTWSSNLVWINDTHTPPPAVSTGMRIRVKIEKSSDNQLLAKYDVYSVI